MDVCQSKLTSFSDALTASQLFNYINCNSEHLQLKTKNFKLPKSRSYTSDVEQQNFDWHSPWVSLVYVNILINCRVDLTTGEERSMETAAENRMIGNVNFHTHSTQKHN